MSSFPGFAGTGKPNRLALDAGGGVSKLTESSAASKKPTTIKAIADIHIGEEIDCLGPNPCQLLIYHVEADFHQWQLGLRLLPIKQLILRA